jgi:hypothetical protein
MAWRFLLGLDESNEEFEPTVKNNSVVVTGGERQHGKKLRGWSNH